MPNITKDYIEGYFYNIPLYILLITKYFINQG